MSECSRIFHIAGDYIANQTNNFYDHSQYNSTGAVINEKKGKDAREKTPPRSPRTTQPKAVETKEHGVERDTFGCSKRVTANHLNLFFHELQQTGWVDTGSNEADFRALFSGRVSDCEIIWTGEAGLGTLKKLFDTLLDELLITLPSGARSVNSVLENHFVDSNGNYVSDLNSSTPAKSALQTIQKLVGILKVRLDTDDIEQVFANQGRWDPSCR